MSLHPPSAGEHQVHLFLSCFRYIFHQGSSSMLEPFLLLKFTRQITVSQSFKKNTKIIVRIRTDFSLWNRGFFFVSCFSRLIQSFISSGYRRIIQCLLINSNKSVNNSCHGGDQITTYLHLWMPRD